MSPEPEAPEVLELIGIIERTIPLLTIAAYIIPVLAETNPPTNCWRSA